MKVANFEQTLTLCRVAQEGVTTIRQWIIICAIYQKEGIETVELTRVMDNSKTKADGPISKGTVSCAVTRLEKAGIVEVRRVKDPGVYGKPRRTHYLTARGERIAEMGMTL